MASVSITQDAIQTALVTFLNGILPGVPAVEGQDNRVPEPMSGDYIVFWPILRDRLAWNIDSYIDCAFTGSISGTTLTVTAVVPGLAGKIAVGLQIMGPGIAAGTQVTALQSGTGGVGTYTVNNSQTVAAETMACGTAALTQKTEIVMQCNVHGPNSSDNAQIIATTIFDEVGRDLFDPDTTGVAPLFADAPRQVPFINGENQWETRYVVDCHLQADIAVIFAQQFADALSVNVISVDAQYPP